MKYLITLFMLPMFAFSQADYDAVKDTKWLTNYSTAMSKAKKQKKNVLVYFTGSDWCAPCKLLKTDLLETSKFKQLSENYILLYIDIPRNKDLLSTKQLKHNNEVVAQHNGKKVFPLFKILDSKGTELDKLSGYSMNGVVDYHLQLLENNM